MVKAISLQDYYNRMEAFYDSDPMIRIATIHRAGAKLERNARLRQMLKGLLDDKDPLVARYAAITLAQSGDVSSLRHLIQAISRAHGQDREELDGCLRNCTRFPFAVLLNERLFVETIPAVKDEGYREVLNKALELTSNEFYEKSERDPSFRETFLKILRRLDGLDGLRVRDGTILDMGRVLSVPMGKQPGFLFCPSRRLFLKFQDESVLNRGYLERGRHVLFVAQQVGSSGADCLYVFEDEAPRQEQLTPEAMTDFARESGLLPGVIVTKWDSPDRVDVLCANGKAFQERYRAQKAFISQFVLIEEKTDMGRSQCHFVAGVRLDPAVIRRIVTDYAAFNNLVLAQLIAIHDEMHPKTSLPRCVVRTEKGEEVTTFIPAPRERSTVLMKECEVCQGKGGTPCQGEFRCFRCKGTGTLTDGRDCLLCNERGTVSGCGGAGRVDCPVCNGDGAIKCEKCDGSGSFHGGACWDCDGDGEQDCFYCRGDRQIRCSACNGKGNHRCRYCQGSRLVFHSKVDCLRS